MKSNTEAPCGIVNSAQPNHKPIYVRTSSEVAKLISSMNDDLANLIWYNPRREEPASLFVNQDTQILERYKHYDVRLTSFTSPRWPTDVPVSTDELARAGWYFTGVEDRVKCPWCHGCVYNWVDGDTGLGEHKRHFPQCEFVKDHIASAFEKVQLPSKASKQAKPLLVTRDNWRQSSAVQAVQELEIYSDDVIEQAVQHQLADKRTSISSFDSQMLLETIFKLEEYTYSNVVKSRSHNLERPSAANPETDVTPSEELYNVKELQKQNETLKSNITCKVCMDNKVGMLFLPCRHLICCEPCSDSVIQCPLCRQRIVGTIKAFL